MASPSADQSWKLMKTLKLAENRLCVDCSCALSSGDVFGSTFGTWLCFNCKEMHKSCGINNDEAAYKNVTHSEWTTEEILRMQNSGGNTHFNATYERYIPKGWTKINVSSDYNEREAWIRAKYLYKLFCLPSKLDRGAAKKRPDQVSNVLPLRIVDFFLIIDGLSEGSPVPSVETELTPVISTCWPDRSMYPDTALPDLVAPFSFPYGAFLSMVEKPPSFFTYVLTDTNGMKFYCANMHIYELIEPPDSLKKKKAAAEAHGDTHLISSSFLYAPKALVILSHYPFYNLFREYLEQIYRVSLSVSSLPLERYVLNFIRELSLPPQGKTEINFALPTKTLQITRPRKNQLPMVDFSYRPLFMSLSVDNIMLLFSALTAELPVCFCSRHISILTPVQEALLSFLFPMTWQGAYIPVLPENMTAILEAPVPFVVGLHRKYLDETPEEMLPPCVIIVDLDNDKIRKGFNDTMDGPRIIDKVSGKLASKLKSKLTEFGSCIYQCHTKKLQCIDESFPQREHMIPLNLLSSEAGVSVKKNVSVAQSGFMSSLTRTAVPVAMAAGNGITYSGAQELCTRSFIASNVAKTMFSTTLLDPGYNMGNNSGGGVEKSNFNAHEIRSAFLRLYVVVFIDFDNYTTQPAASAKNSISSRISGSFDTPVQTGKRPHSQSTPTWADDQDESAPVQMIEDPQLDQAGFLKSHNNDPFIKNMLTTQMFDKFFIESCSSDTTQPEIKFFNESILEKSNRSKIKLSKSSTPFLSDLSDDVVETYTCPTPSNWGLPAGKTYSYSKFPSTLSSDLMGPLRPAKMLVSAPESARANAVAAKTSFMIKSRLCGMRTAAATETSGSMSLDDTVAYADVEYFMAAKVHYDYVNTLLTKCQAWYRMKSNRNAYLLRKKQIADALAMKKMKKILKKFFRMAVCKVYLCVSLRRIRRLQSLYRSRRVRRMFLKKMRGIVVVQSVIRKWKVFRTQSLERTHTIAKLREQILLLWQIENTSLLYRSRFWVFFSKGTFMNIAIHREELLRLYTELGLLTSLEYRTFSMEKFATISQKLSSKSLTEGSLSGDGRTNMRECKRLLEEEREVIYTKLKGQTDGSDRTKFFEAFQLSSQKKRKQTLSRRLWLDTEKITISLTVVFAVMNEIRRTAATTRNSLNISTATTLSSAISQEYMEIAIQYTSGRDRNWARDVQGPHITKACVAISLACMSAMHKILAEEQKRKELERKKLEMASQHKCKFARCCLHGSGSVYMNGGGKSPVAKPLDARPVPRSRGLLHSVSRLFGNK